MKKNSQHTTESKQKNAQAQRLNAVIAREKRSQSENAVSPVIGVILMVAITVILAAVIAAFIFGMSGNISKTRVVAVTGERINTTHAAILVQGGQDMDDLTKINVTVNGEYSGTINNPQVGSTLYFDVPNTSTKISVIGSFLNSADQVILDTNL